MECLSSRAETKEAIAALEGKIDDAAAIKVWEAALATSWQRPPVWVWKYQHQSLGGYVAKHKSLILKNARNWTRTSTGLPPRDFKSLVSTISPSERDNGISLGNF